MRRLSVIVPCRNELAHVDGFLDALSAQRLPEGWTAEWLVADGDSDDGTRQRLEARCATDRRLHIIDNPRRIVSTGLNLCLAHATGEVIARLDVHARYAEDYLAQCIAAIERTRADNVGGAWVAQGETPMQQAIAAAFQNRWVVGGARSRDMAHEGAVETVFLGCWPRASFERFGNFDENLVRNQDDEHNLRIVRGGGLIWQSAAIRSIYFPRGNVGRLFAQQRQYGYWRSFVWRKHGRPGSWRQLVPAAFVGALAIALLASPWCGSGLFIALVAVYGLYLAVVSAAGAVSREVFLRLPIAIAAYHFGYGIGTWHGLLAVCLRRVSPAEMGRLTR